MPGRHSATPDGGGRWRTRGSTGEAAEPTQTERTERGPKPSSGGGAGWKRASLALLAGVIVLFSVAGWSALSTVRPSGCQEGGSLTVAAAPEIAPVVESVVSPDDGD